MRHKDDIKTAAVDQNQKTATGPSIMSDSSFQQQIQSLQSQMKDGLVLGSGTSDECSGSEADEQKFLKSRRASIASSGHNMTEEDLKEEESRRRRFLAQFSDRREVIDGQEIVADANRHLDSDSDSISSISSISSTSTSTA
ncbi:hypothetical protein PHYBLDRAFT_160104 [Phycomyces blakesleeanus NRRL 1555(-)]|uniref:Uncharacterized protein n=2 Tax=Phycomyces blakesleeanus TaxID=4837 RepID=A0A162NE20_PHYB8|nr:hypothetical protein PHYBLDRAFT_160104 [Phycomyces blakesleeanus NRRL 1555(-)]OAD68694.1 hypothetical protein PHYBLDRAFT_160104 [Phycomyces blakesleeanus NRRL 1555(-)]|eukprot:XP_018286734.1 hypothetical protein PHYBLDRAFT_160104 [Phycomyces blakesleeanus NRRL 1555(-)]